MRALYEALSYSKKVNRQKGFTLIELLVVVAIIAILAAIAIPAFNRYRQTAQERAAMANARTCLSQIAAFLAENPNATPAQAQDRVPQNCSVAYQGNTISCTCDSPDQSLSVTCTLDENTGTVDCQRN